MFDKGKKSYEFLSWIEVCSGSKIPPMRLTEFKIKDAIVHPIEEIRLTALKYFTDAATKDESSMPLVIQTVDQNGTEISFKILRDAQELPQSEPTIKWLVAQLHRRDLDLTNIHDDNFRFAIALILSSMRPTQVAEHYGDILQAPLFPPELECGFTESTAAANWSWQQAWSHFLSFVDELSTKPEWTSADHRRLHRLVEHLGHYREGAKQVLELLNGTSRSITASLTKWLERDIVRIAGLMELKQAIPLIIQRAHLGEDDIADECGDALGQIGTDEVVDAIRSDWEYGDHDFRLIMCSALEKIHTDHCVKACLEFLRTELDGETQLELGNALISHFAFDCIDEIRELVSGHPDDLVPDQRDLRFRLVAAAEIMGISFPEKSDWHRDASETNWGSFDLKPSRISQNFRP